MSLPEILKNPGNLVLPLGMSNGRGLEGCGCSGAQTSTASYITPSAGRMGGVGFDATLAPGGAITLANGSRSDALDLISTFNLAPRVSAPSRQAIRQKATTLSAALNVLMANADPETTALIDGWTTRVLFENGTPDAVLSPSQVDAITNLATALASKSEESPSEPTDLMQLDMALSSANSPVHVFQLLLKELGATSTTGQGHPYCYKWPAQDSLGPLWDCMDRGCNRYMSKGLLQPAACIRLPFGTRPQSPEEFDCDCEVTDLRKRVPWWVKWLLIGLAALAVLILLWELGLLEGLAALIQALKGLRLAEAGALSVALSAGSLLVGGGPVGLAGVPSGDERRIQERLLRLEESLFVE